MLFGTKVVLVEMLELAQQTYNLYNYMYRGVPAPALYVLMIILFMNALTVSTSVFMRPTTRNMVAAEVADLVYVDITLCLAFPCLTLRVV